MILEIGRNGKQLIKKITKLYLKIAYLIGWKKEPKFSYTVKKQNKTYTSTPKALAFELMLGSLVGILTGLKSN